MSEEKRTGQHGQVGREAPDERSRNSTASRARNRTVMLTPEMTGQVRALLYQNSGDEENVGPGLGAKRDPINELLPPMDWTRPDHAVAREGDTQEVARGDVPRSEDVPFHARSERPSSSTDRLHRDAVAEPPDMHRAPQQPGFNVNPAVSVRRTGSASFVRRSVPTVQPHVASKVVGFLVSYDKSEFGEVHFIRAGRWLVTSRPTDHGEFILIEDPTVSPLHAIVRATKEGKIQVLDQLSEFGTGVTKFGTKDEQEVAGTMVNIDHGDILRLGERRFLVCTIPQGGAEEE